MKFIQIDEYSRFFFLVTVTSLLLFANGFYLFFPTAICILLLYLLQRPFKPGVFSVLVMQHYVQIVAGTWLCNYLARDINYNTASRATAIVASTVGLAFLVAPLIYVNSRIKISSKIQLVALANQFSLKKVFNLYIIVYFFVASFAALAFFFSGITQILVSLVKVKWVLFLLFGFISLLRNDNRTLFFICVALEFISGFFAFFSEFKVVLYFLVILICSLIDKLDFKRLMQAILIVAFLAGFGLLWTNIKGDYRSFINSGSSGQVVNVEKGDAMDKLINLSTNVETSKLDGSIIQMLDRLQYTYHFAKTIDRVPEYIPFENGANWLSSLEYTTTPRFLNPNKPSHDASIKTTKYTGINYLGRDRGISFSLGYFPDCYIDFGLYGMMLMLLALGTLYAVIYRYLLVKSTTNMLFNYAVVGAFFMEFNALELDSTYLLGRLFSSFLTFWALVKFGFPTIFKYISVTPDK